MKREMIVYDGKHYYFKDSTENKKITKREADRIFQTWQKENYAIHRQYDRFIHVWIEK